MSPSQSFALPTAALFGLLLGGCASTPTRYETEWEDQKKDLISQMVIIKCADPTKTGHELGNCDSVSEGFYKELPSLRTAECDERNVRGSECSRALLNTFMARLQLKYPHADWAHANVWCQANPRECDFGNWIGASFFEGQLRTTHNEAIAQMSKEAQAEVQARSDQAGLENQKAGNGLLGGSALGTVLQSMGQGLQDASRGPATRCTTRESDGQYFTTCH